MITINAGLIVPPWNHHTTVIWWKAETEEHVWQQVKLHRLEPERGLEIFQKAGPWRSGCWINPGVLADFFLSAELKQDPTGCWFVQKRTPCLTNPTWMQKEKVRINSDFSFHGGRKDICIFRGNYLKPLHLPCIFSKKCVHIYTVVRGKAKTARPLLHHLLLNTQLPTPAGRYNPVIPGLAPLPLASCFETTSAGFSYLGGAAG